MCDSTGDACWQLSVAAFSRSTHIKMLTRIINLQVNIELVRLNKQDGVCGGGWGGGVGCARRPLISVDLSLYSP